MKKFDPSLLQSRSGSQMIILILKLTKKMMEYRKEWYRSVKDDPNFVSTDIIVDDEYTELTNEVKMLKKSHHLALNSLKNFNAKTHSEQLKYLFSGVHRERYKMP